MITWGVGGIFETQWEYSRVGVGALMGEVLGGSSEHVEDVGNEMLGDEGNE